MRPLAAAAVFGMGVVAGLAQVPLGPVVGARGVLNEHTRQPAPTSVAPGGLLRINGLNLGPAEGLKAGGAPWPTTLGDPAIQVLINNRPAPIHTVSPGTIVCQVPVETPNGMAQVVVRKGEMTSRPARFSVNASVPSVKTKTGAGYGEAAADGSGLTLTLTVSGLGATEPRVESGQAAPAAGVITPRLDVRAYVDGIPSKPETRLAGDRVGEFDVGLTLPAAAEPGEVIQLYSAGRMANLVTAGKLAQPAVWHMPLPNGLNDIRGLQTADLRGSYAAVNGPRNDQGCYPTWTMDLARARSVRVPGCPSAPNANNPSPVVPLNDQPALFAWEGPFEGQAPNVTARKVWLLTPLADAPVGVDLPAPAAAVTANAAGQILAILPGNPPQAVSIDVATGETKAAEPAGGAANPGAGGAGAPANLRVDLGDGLNQVLSPPQTVGQGIVALVVGDNLDEPKKAKLAILTNQGQLREAREFPESWLPLAAPPARAGAPGQAPPQTGTRFPVSTFFDPPTRTLYVALRSTDGARHAVWAWATDADAKVLSLPSGWFVTACTAQIPFQNIELARRLALFASRVPETEFKQQCPAQGFLLIGLGNQEVAAVEIQGNGQFNANGNAGDLNDYLFGLGIDPSLPAGADTLHVLDAVTASSIRFDVPAGVNAFANAVGVRDMDLLVGVARNRVPGDAGFVVFDLERAETRLLPTPDGFDTVSLIGVFPATRKLVARGVRTGNSGAQYLIYDLVTSDLMVVPNPDGVTWVGNVPAQPGGGGGQPAPTTPMQRPNVKSNSVTALTYSADRRPVGVIVVRVP